MPCLILLTVSSGVEKAGGKGVKAESDLVHLYLSYSLTPTSSRGLFVWTLESQCQLLKGPILCEIYFTNVF